MSRPKKSINSTTLTITIEQSVRDSVEKIKGSMSWGEWIKNDPRIKMPTLISKPQSTEVKTNNSIASVLAKLPTKRS